MALPTAALGVLLAAPAAHAGLLFPESGGSPNADSIKTLYVMVFVLALVIFFVVEGALVFAMFKYRARKGRVAAQIHGNTRLEIGWTVGAFLILLFISAFTFAELGAIKNPKNSLVDANGNVAMTDDTLYASTDKLSVKKGPSMKIVVNGQQYVWRYKYPGADGVLAYTDMVVPVGETVLLDIQSDDVAHSWWIPKLGGKMDAIPGYTNRTWFQIPPSAIPEGSDRVIYTGQCAELCGRNHANMLARVIGMRMDDYKAWLAEKAKEIKADRIAVAAQQKALLQQQSAGQTP